MNANVWDVTETIADLVRAGLAGRTVDLDALADPEVPLAELLPVRTDPRVTGPDGQPAGCGSASDGERSRSTELIRSTTSGLITPFSSVSGRTIRYRSGVYDARSR